MRPACAVEGGRVTIAGEGLQSAVGGPPAVEIGARQARVVHASRRELTVIVPAGLAGGRTAIRVAGAAGEPPVIDVGVRVVSGIHQVDNPAVGADGTLYFTFSGPRGEETPVSMFRVRDDGFREPFLSGITNATSMAFAPDGGLHVSSRNDGAVYRVASDGSYKRLVADLGVTCGLAFSPDGTLYAGDRAGTVFRVAAGEAVPFATLPASVAAFHLTWGPDEALYVASPTLATYDPVYRIAADGGVTRVGCCFGRPQGLAFDARGALHVVEALAGASGVYRVEADGSASLVLSAEALVGLAFDPDGGLVVASNHSAYRVGSPPA